MHSYESLRKNHSSKVCQTIDGAILVYDYFELGEVFIALAAMLVFGVIIHSWELMLLSLVAVLGVLPVVRRRNKKGILFHYPYRKLGMRLPGLVNPRGNKKYSD